MLLCESLRPVLPSASLSSASSTSRLTPSLHHYLVCPNCANILTVSALDTGMNRLECRTCPYEYEIVEPLYSRREFQRKEREDVFGGPGAWDNAQKGKVQCPNEGCEGEEAAFFQVQIRSADEPMTMFYKVRQRASRKLLMLIEFEFGC